jgi:hypothetical protein
MESTSSQPSAVRRALDWLKPDFSSVDHDPARRELGVQLAAVGAAVAAIGLPTAVLSAESDVEDENDIDFRARLAINARIFYNDTLLISKLLDTDKRLSDNTREKPVFLDETFEVGEYDAQIGASHRYTRQIVVLTNKANESELTITMVNASLDPRFVAGVPEENRDNVWQSPPRSFEVQLDGKVIAEFDLSEREGFTDMLDIDDSETSDVVLRAFSKKLDDSLAADLNNLGFELKDRERRKSPEFLDARAEEAARREDLVRKEQEAQLKAAADEADAQSIDSF